MLRRLIGLAAVLSAGALVAQEPPAAPPAAAPAAPVQAAPQPFGIVGAPGGTGPTPAVVEYLKARPENTYYHPARLPAEPLPIVLWGNGGCRDDSLSAAQFLREVSSHGYFVVVAGPPREEPKLIAANPPITMPVTDRARQLEKRGPDATTPEQIVAGLDWALARNADPKSPWYRHLDPSRIAVMGHSCGGLQAIRISADPRIKATVLFNSGVFNNSNDGISALSVKKAELNNLHAPIAYIIGGPVDIAWPQAIDDVARIVHVPLFFAHSPIGHSGTFRTAENGGQYAQIAVRWLDYQLKGVAEDKAFFTGPDCGLCKWPGWSVPRPLWP